MVLLDPNKAAELFQGREVRLMSDTGRSQTWHATGGNVIVSLHLHSDRMCGDRISLSLMPNTDGRQTLTVDASVDMPVYMTSPGVLDEDDGRHAVVAAVKAFCRLIGVAADDGIEITRNALYLELKKAREYLNEKKDHLLAVKENRS